MAILKGHGIIKDDLDGTMAFHRAAKPPGHGDYGRSGPPLTRQDWILHSGRA
jgi:hypothetical protein